MNSASYEYRNKSARRRGTVYIYATQKFKSRLYAPIYTRYVNYTYCSSVRYLAAVILCYGLAIFQVFMKWNANYQIFLLVNTCQSGDITYCFGVKYKSCSAGYLFVNHF